MDYRLLRHTDNFSRFALRYIRCRCENPENSVRDGVCDGVLKFFIFIFSYRRISERVVRTSLEKHLDPMGPIASGGMFVSVFLRKRIFT